MSSCLAIVIGLCGWFAIVRYCNVTFF